MKTLVARDLLFQKFYENGEGRDSQSVMEAVLSPVSPIAFHAVDNSDCFLSALLFVSLENFPFLSWEN